VHGEEVTRNVHAPSDNRKGNMRTQRAGYMKKGGVTTPKEETDLEPEKKLKGEKRLIHPSSVI